MPRWSHLLATLVLLSCAAPSPPTPPNIVMIVIDDLGWTDTGVYASSFYRTPAIDDLAAGGMRFTQFYTASPVCSPTRASLMTGRHPARLHLTNWIGGEQDGLLLQADYLRALPLEEVTIGEALRDAGYRTGYIGKWHLGEGERLPVDQGFEWSFAVNHAGQPGSYFPPYQNPDWPITNVPDLEDDPPGSYLTDRLTDRAVEFLEAGDSAGRPFFLVLSHYAVHTPLQAKTEKINRYAGYAEALGDLGEAGFEVEHDAVTKLRQDNHTYAAMIESTDESVARVLGALDRLGIADNTVVVFVSDNGGLSTLMRRSPNMATANRPLRAGKGWLYEGGIRAPLIVRWPGVTRPGAVNETMAMTTDLFPTLLEAAGRTVPAGLDGSSLVPLLRGEADTPHDTLYWHFPHYHGSGNRPGGAMRVGDWKLVEWFETGEVELYDLGRDLGEREDLAATEPARAEAMRAALANWRRSVDARMPKGR